MSDVTYKVVYCVHIYIWFSVGYCSYTDQSTMSSSEKEQVQTQTQTETQSDTTSTTAGTAEVASIVVESEGQNGEEGDVELPTATATSTSKTVDQKGAATADGTQSTDVEQTQDQELTYLDKSLINWTVEDVCAWATSETALPERVVEKLAEHRFTGPTLAQLTERKLRGFGAEEEDAQHAEKAIDTLLTMKAKEDPIEDVKVLAKFTQMARGWRHRRATLTEVARKFILSSVAVTSFWVHLLPVCSAKTGKR